MHRAVDIAFALASLFLLFHLVSCQSLHYIETEVDDDNPALTYAADTSAALLSQWNSLNASTAAACAVCVSRGLDPTLVWGGEVLFDLFVPMTNCDIQKGHGMKHMGWRLCPSHLLVSVSGYVSHRVLTYEARHRRQR